MPRKSGSRPGAPGGSESRARRPVRQLPRPTASVPIGADAPARPSVDRTVVQVAAAPPRTPYTSSRGIRPSRASSFPAITDYGYVFADLRRIGLLAAVAFLVLTGLTFVVH
jgi:hypothetical protein